MTNSTREIARVVSEKTRNRLVKLAGPDGVAILEDLFGRLSVESVTVPAGSFRVAHESRLECIRRLVQLSFIANIHDATEVYRLELSGLAVVSNQRAHQILVLADAVLRYIVFRYRQDPDNRNNQVTIGAITNAIEQPEVGVREALRYLVSTPAVNARSGNFPESPDAYVIATEQSITFHSLEPLIDQLADWAGTSAAMPLSLLGNTDSEKTRFDKIVSGIKNHRVLVWLFVIGLGITLLRGIVGAVRDLITWTKPWWN